MQTISRCSLVEHNIIIYDFKMEATYDYVDHSRLEDQKKLTTKGLLPNFLDAVTVWVNKPHVVNRRLCGTKILSIIPADTEDTVKILTTKWTSWDTSDKGQEDTRHLVLETDFKGVSDRFVLVLRELIPKQPEWFPTLVEMVVYDSFGKSFTFFPLHYKCGGTNVTKTEVRAPSEVIYRLTYTDGKKKSIILSSNGIPSQQGNETVYSQVTVQWLCDTLLSKIVSWTSEEHLNTSITSLKLVGVDRYSVKYADLKKKYGPQLVQNWSESTDPQKFVYEDIAIATYLLLLWEEERERTGSSRHQTFVDLGCGNGLLVYILTAEGHRGVGIDLRRRKIWDLYEANVQLQERPITPSAENLFPEYDWIIGNHSDELTPWIPVIAARSSYTCSYFVLPCCHHDFNGRFNSKKQGESQYRTYLTFVAQVGQVCGFEVEEDTLRIPSTKRVCQIGRHRKYSKDEEHVMDGQIQAFINLRCLVNAGVSEQSVISASLSSTDSNHNAIKDGNPHFLKRTHHTLPSEGDSICDSIQHCGADYSKDCKASCCIGESSSAKSADHKGEAEAKQWMKGFSARSSSEPVRNCQQILQTTKDKVVHIVFEAVMAADDSEVVASHTGKPWRRGGSIFLSSVAQMLDKSTLWELKSQCGGVQTLLRNHSHIFQVSGGKVQLRDFSASDPWAHRAAAKSHKKDAGACYKTTLCWFHGNHPDGCPRHAEKCKFAHGLDELRPRIETKRI